MNSPSTILIVDDEPSMLRYLRTILEVDSYRVETLSNGLEAIERVQHSPVPDLVILDLLMPEIGGIETLERLREVRPELKVVMLTCANEPRMVVQAIRLGAHDYLTKPFQKAELDAAIRNSLRFQPNAIAKTTAADRIEDLGEDLLFVTASAAMRKIRAEALQVAKINVPVLILGESGTGKEVVARLIYKHSGRAPQTFLKVNCAALPADLLESELFGYEAGAFTGASRAKPGKFELCNKGTIFLDEIGEMSPELQAKLLHVLQDQEFSRLGSRSSVKVDVRILAATNVEIRQALKSKKLREDLYYRLNAVTLHLPPLRERKEEIPLLLKQFVALWAERYARPALPISQRLLEACLQFPWPGNVRQLENLAKRYIILNDEELIVNDLATPAKSDQGSKHGTDVQTNSQPSIDLKSLLRGLKGEAEKEAIYNALEQTNWHRKEAARLLKISYKALLYKVRQYGIDQRVVLPAKLDTEGPDF